MDVLTETQADLGPVGLGWLFNGSVCSLLEGCLNWAHLQSGRGVSKVSVMQLEDT